MERQSCIEEPAALEALRLWRIRCGEVFTLRDGSGVFFRARLKEMDDQGALIVPFETIDDPEGELEIRVYQALPQKERFEWVLQKLTEIGVKRIVPFTSTHSISMQERDAAQKKSHRWPEVVRKAARQCRRAAIPELGSVLEWEEMLAELEDVEIKLILAEKNGSWSMREALNHARIQQVALLVGPEGGFSAEEIECARTRGILPVSLGARILRTETAALVGATLVQGIVGDYA
ncbi:MAG: 16S rRNA (uracil(1498)-N(3))-methyltransferase [Desulfuromonadaceae bacterium]|nr:16S rRNA (uracil(1498)-N(3))-methyltransferase [Geobacteraceae bacterium]